MDNYKGAPPSTSSTTLGYVVSPHGCSGVRRHFELFAQTNDEHSTPIHKRPPTLSWSTNFTASVHGYRAIFNSRFPHPLRVKTGAVNSHKCCARSDDVGDEPHTKYKSRISECRRTGACSDNTLRTERPEHAIPQRCNGFASPAACIPQISADAISVKNGSCNLHGNDVAHTFMKPDSVVMSSRWSSSMSNV